MKTKTKKILKYTIFGGITAGAGVLLYLTFKTNVSEDDARRYKPKYFDFDDLFKSDTADAHGIDNTTKDKTITTNLRALCKAVIDPAIEEYLSLYGGKVSVNSGYRCAEVNSLIKGSSPDSQHTKGEAVDITTGSKEGNKKLFEIIRKQNKFDQLIDESDYQWVHCSFKRTGYNRQKVSRL